jgi:hypothetical protein
MTNLEWLRERRKIYGEPRYGEIADEIERLTAELDKAHRLLSQSVGWQRDAEIVKAKQAAEIERLTAALREKK